MREARAIATSQDVPRTTTRLHDVIVASAARAISLQSADGSMPPGHNGPYHDRETPVRNTSHWLITFLKAYQLSGERRFQDAARLAAAYLCSDDARPHGATFWHRTGGRDRCNGLIGQAWTIEALAEAAAALDEPRLRQLGESVFLLHPFDDRLGLWRRVEVDGTDLGYDPTFNHQLWFAAATGLLQTAGSDLPHERVLRFMERVPEDMGLYRSGLIVHAITGPAEVSGPSSVRQRLSRLVHPGRSAGDRRRMYRKSIGYHAFNLYAFALLKRALPDHPLWNGEPLGRAVRYLETDEYSQGLEGNEFGYAYNPPGFEVPFALQAFADRLDRAAGDETESWVSTQLRRCYDFDDEQMSLGTEDPTTHAARIYEATRLPDIVLERESVGPAA